MNHLCWLDLPALTSHLPPRMSNPASIAPRAGGQRGYRIDLGILQRASKSQGRSRFVRQGFYRSSRLAADLPIAPRGSTFSGHGAWEIPHIVVGSYLRGLAANRVTASSGPFFPLGPLFFWHRTIAKTVEQQAVCNGLKLGVFWNLPMWLVERTIRP